MAGDASVRRRCRARVLTTVPCCVAALWFLTTPLLAQTPAAGTSPARSRWLGPEEAPVRPVVRDVAPVYRGPVVDTLATIRQRGTLRVGVAAVAPMVNRNADGTLSGFSIDLATRLAEDLGVRAEFVETSWAQIVPDLLERHFDVIVSGLWVTPERALVVNFTQPTSAEGIYLVANKKMTAGLGSLAAYDAPGVRLAVAPGTIQAEVAARRFPRATIVPTEGDMPELALVLSGKAHAALVATFAPAGLVAQASELTLPSPDPLQRTHTAMAIRKGDADFLNTLDSWLAYHRGTGWLDERAAYWTEAASKLQ